MNIQQDLLQKSMVKKSNLNTWKLNNTLLNNLWIKEKSQGIFKEYTELNENISKFGRCG